MNTVDRIISEVFRTLPEDKKYEICKNYALENRELKKQLSIYDVSISKISDEQKQKAYDSAIKLVNEIFDW